MKLKLDRLISIATLVASLVAIFLVLKKPAPVAPPQAPAAIAAHAQAFDQKMEQFERAARETAPSSSASSSAASSPMDTTSTSAGPDTGASATPPKAEVHLNSDEVGAALAQSLRNAGAGALGATDGELSPNSNLGNGEPSIKDQQVNFEGDLVHGQFLTEIGGKDVWVTVSGHLGSSNGYATFDPTEFKVGDLNVPVSLVNPALQKKLAEQQDRLKLPENVGGLKVEKGELVLQQK
jgi:hypothetical protein